MFLCSIFLSCTESFDVDSTRQKTSEWMRQIDHALSLTQQVNSNDQIVLTDYNYVGYIKNETAKTAILNEVFSENSDIVLNNLEFNRSGFTTWGDKQYFSDDYRNNLLSKVADQIEPNKTQTVELIWSYKNKTYRSTALVNDTDGIIYDNIASYAINYSAKKEQIKSHKILKRPLTRAATELVNAAFADSIAADTSIRVFSTSDYSQEVELVTGKRAWWYIIEVTSAFTRNGILGYRNFKVDSDAALGWQCRAEAQTISGELRVSNYHEFAWAWAYGSGGTAIQISFLGSGFDVQGGERRSYGTEIHMP